MTNTGTPEKGCITSRATVVDGESCPRRNDSTSTDWEFAPWPRQHRPVDLADRLVFSFTQATTTVHGLSGDCPLFWFAEHWVSLPQIITLRIVRIRLEVKGFRVLEYDLVTTLLDASDYTIDDSAELYFRRGA